MIRVFALAISLVAMSLAEEKVIITCCLTHDDKECKDFSFDFQFEGFSNHGPKNYENYYCGYDDVKDEIYKPKYQDELDQKVEDGGKLKVINEIDSTQWNVNDDNLAKFLSDFDITYMDRSRPKGPDYLIMDNFLDFFNLEQSDL